MPIKSTRAFRTISEAGDELDLQPHVLRFWESKFPQIEPMKRSGGRRLYRPEDIEFLRGIKILLHREKHPIKDVQKLIRIKGAQSVIELGRSQEKASRPKEIKDTNLVPRRIRPLVRKKAKPAKPVSAIQVQQEPQKMPISKPDDEIVRRVVPAQVLSKEEAIDTLVTNVFAPVAPSSKTNQQETATTEAVEPVKPIQETVQAMHKPNIDREGLEIALKKLQALKSRWAEFK